MYAKRSSANCAIAGDESPLSTAVADSSRQATRAPTRYAASRMSAVRPLRASPRPRA